MSLCANSFPHLLDLILDFASPPCLISLRGVSREVCARIDARLFRNIVVTSIPGPPANPTSRPPSPSAFSTSPSALSSNPPTTGPRLIILTTLDGHRLPAPPLPSRTTEMGVGATLRPLLRNTRTVSLRALSLSACNTLAAVLPRLDVVHRHTTQPWDSNLLKASTYVDYIDLDSTLPSGEARMPRGDTPMDLERHIVRFAFSYELAEPHIAAAAGSAMSVPPLPRLEPAYVPQAVVVLDPRGTPELGRAMVAQFTAVVAALFGNARPEGVRCREGVAPRSITLVAFDELERPAQLPKPPLGGAKRIVPPMSSETRAWLEESARDGLEMCTQDIDELHILSRAEWEASEAVEVLQR